MKKAIITSILLLITVGVAVFIIPLFLKKDLTKVIAEALNTDPSNLILNLPPHPGRYPGSILLPHNNGFIVYEHSNEFNNLNDDAFNLKANLSQIGSFGGISAGVLNGVFSNFNHFNVDIEISNGRILELTIPQLKERIKNNDAVLSAINKRLKPIILHRVFEGIITYHIAAIDEEGARILAETKYNIDALKLRNEDISVRGSVLSERKISFTYSKPSVIAFEALQANLVVNDLSGSVYEPVLTLLSKEELENLHVQNLIDQGFSSHSTSWGLITIASGHFKHLASEDVPEATRSAQLVHEYLNSFNPIYLESIISSEINPMTDDYLLNWSIDLTLKLLADPLDYLIVYYTGHGLSLPNGELALLQGNLNKDFAERALENLNPLIASPSDGILTAQTLYNSLEMSGVPFTLIIDACYPNDEMQRALNHVSMSLGSEDGSLLVYKGNATYITNEMGHLSRSLWNLGNRFAYRTNENAVIFSSKPGVKALFRENPTSIYDYKLSPLASRIVGYSSNHPDQSLAEVILGIIDNKGGLGEVTLYGSVSWSSLDYMKDILENVRRP